MSDERADRTRMDKVIDFLLGELLDRRVRQHPDHQSEADQRYVREFAPMLVRILESTAHRPHLPNRQRLLELVEAAMPKEASA